MRTGNCGLLNVEKNRSCKSETIRNMIIRKNKDRMDKLAPSIAKKDSVIQRLLKEEAKLERVKKETEKKLKDIGGKISTRTKELKIARGRRGYYDEKGRYKDERRFCSDYNICYIKDEETIQLQKASDLFALGRKKEAKEIWDGLIKKHKLIDE